MGQKHIISEKWVAATTAFGDAQFGQSTWRISAGERLFDGSTRGFLWCDTWAPVNLVRDPSAKDCSESVSHYTPRLGL